MTTQLTRRTFVQGFAAGTTLAGVAPVAAQAPTKVRVGYLHVVMVDAQLLLGIELGTFKKEGIEP